MNIIITGASRGIGYETVKLMSKNGNDKILAIARGQESLAGLKNECLQENGFNNVFPLALDLTKKGSSDILADEIKKEMGFIDVLVNNAGLLINKPFAEMDDNDFDRVFDINVKSVFRLVRNLLPYFSENSHIVNIGSMGGVQGSVKFPGLSLYSTSKGALAILTECLAEEFKERQIKVNCLSLGSARTEMFSEAFPGYDSPLSAGEMARFVADFALNGHRWFNGKILPVALSTP